MKATHGGITLQDVEEMGALELQRWLAAIVEEEEGQAQEVDRQGDVPAPDRRASASTGVLDLEWERNKRNWLAQQPKPRR